MNLTQQKSLKRGGERGGDFIRLLGLDFRELKNLSKDMEIFFSLDLKLLHGEFLLSRYSN